MVDVGADFFSATELAALKLPGLPDRREHVSRLASRMKWAHRERQGRGGGREFALSALPNDARVEILRRRLQNATSQQAAIGKPHAPLPSIDNLKARQAERLSARTVLLAAFDRFKGKRSDRAALDAFVVAFGDDLVELPEWTRPLLPKLSRRTLERWLAARKAGRDLDLAGRWAGGRKSFFEQSPDLAEFVLGVHAAQPALRIEDLTDLIPTNFPEGVPDSAGVPLPSYPSSASVARFLHAWKSNAQNATALAALNDPDRYRSKFRFAIGNASAGVVRPNQRWEIDASPTDVLCSDGRNSMYVVIDVYSRRMMALISRTPRTVASLLLVARACRAWGVPEELWTDNGSDFVSKHFVLAMRQLGIHHHPAPKFSPDRKPHVERAIGTVQSKFMPRYEGIGYGGNSVAMRAKIEARSSFAARLGESEKERLGSTVHSGDLQDALSAWIANRYETAPHAGLRNRTPLEVWEEGTAVHVPRMASDEAIGLLLMPPARDEVRTVTRKGITVDGIDYVSPNMVVGQRVQVRLDPADLGSVWVYTDTDPWQFVGLATNLDLMGVDRAEAAAKIHALQADLVRQGKGEIRRLIRNADVHGVQRRFIGATPAEAPAPATITYLTPALEEAARAARTRGRREYEPATPEEIERHAAFVARVRADEDSAPEETAAERYARWKALRARHDTGTEISADEAEWLRSYPTSGEWKAHRMAEQDQSDA